MAAGNLTLLAFAAATPYWPAPSRAQAVQQSTDISCLPGKQQQTRRTLLPAFPAIDHWVDSWDRRTDTVPLHRPCRILCDQCQ